MSRRVKTFDPKRPNYFGKDICTKEEFIGKFLEDPEFLRLFVNWQQNEFKRKFAPSIDRIDNEKGYKIDNLRFTSHYENSTKDTKIACRAFLNGELMSEFESQKECAKYIGIQESTLTLYFQGRARLSDGWSVERV